MAFSTVDGGFAAPKKNNGALDSILKDLNSGPKNPTASQTQAVQNVLGGYHPTAPSIPLSTAGGQVTPTSQIPAYTPGGPGPSDGGGGSYNPNIGSVDLGGYGGSSTPAMPTIDFNSILQKALANLGFNNLDNSLQKAREQLIIRWGDPALASLAGFGIDPQAGAFAQQNYLSGNADLARLDKQRTQSRQAVVNRLAGHGLLFSGDLGYGLNNAEQAYGNARSDLTSQYLQQLQQLLENTLAQKQQLRANLANALISSFGQYVQDPMQLIGLYGG